MSFASTPTDKLSPEITCSPSFPGWLESQKISLAFSTYQTNRVFFIGLTLDGKLSVTERFFDRPMGLYASASNLFLTTRYQLWQLESIPEIPQKEDFDKIYIPRLGYTTGDVNAHEIALASDRQSLLFVNTLFSCIATLHPQYHFNPIWQPPFISKLAPEDRCHLNGMAMKEGKPRYVTACSSTNTAAGWRQYRHNGGVIIDVESNEIACTGLSMPHSPRLYNDKLWVLNSGTGFFGYVDLNAGKFQPVVFCPGFVRGLAFYKNFAIVGLSQARHDNNFQGLVLDEQLAANRQIACCGLMVIDLNTGNILHQLIFNSIVKELFDVAVLPEVRQALALGFQTDEIERLVTFPNSGGIISTRPSVQSFSAAKVTITENVETSPSSLLGNPVGELGLETAAEHFDRGRQLQKQGKLEEAEACFREAIALQPDYLAAYNNLGNLLQVQGKIPEAIAIFESALQQNPNVETRYIASLHCNLASAQLLAGNLEASISGYQKALRLDANFYLAHLNLGKVYASRREVALAEGHFREVLRLKPDNSEAQSAIAKLTSPHLPISPSPSPPISPSPVKYQMVYHLNAVNSIEYDAVTFPSIKKRWRSHQQRGELIGVSASVSEQLVGMAIAEILPTLTAELISLFVSQGFRQQGIGENLVKFLEKGLIENTASVIEVKYQVTELTNIALEPLLKQRGWLPPKSVFLLAQTTTNKISQAPWLYKYPLPETFEIFPWLSLTPTEKQIILARKDYPETLNPFSNDPRIEPLNSLGLRYKGEVIGWMITHRVAPDTIRYSSLVIGEKFQKLGRGISLIAEAIKRQIASDVANYTFSVAVENASMMKFVNRHLRPYLTGMGESRIAVKLLEKPLGFAKASNS